MIDKYLMTASQDCETKAGIDHNRIYADFYLPDKDDLDLLWDFYEKIYQFLRLEYYDHYFVTVYKAEHPDAVSALLFALFLKIKQPSKKVFLGGFRHFTGKLLHEIDNVDYIDSLVVGRGEEPVRDLVNDLKNNRQLRAIYKNKFTEPDVDIRPDFESFRNLDCFRFTQSELEGHCGVKLDRQIEQNLLYIPYKFEIGCFWRQCKYCGCSSLHGLFKTKDIKQIVRDLQALKNKTKTDLFIFYNNNFNSDIDSAKELLQAFIDKELNIIWSDSFNLRLLDDELLDLLQQAGCMRMDLGVVTLDPYLQKFYSSIMDDNRYLENLRKIHERGMWVDINIIVNLPYSYSADEELAILKDYAPYIDAATLNNYRPYPSDLWFNHKDYGLKRVNGEIKVNDAKTIPIYFLEKEFNGTLEDRKQMFADNFQKCKDYVLKASYNV